MALIAKQMAVIDRLEPSIETPNMRFFEILCLWDVQEAHLTSTPNITGNISGNQTPNTASNIVFTPYFIISAKCINIWKKPCFLEGKNLQITIFFSTFAN